MNFAADTMTTYNHAHKHSYSFIYPSRLGRTAPPSSSYQHGTNRTRTAETGKSIVGEYINDFDVIINATSLGLNKESINLDFSKFANNKLFYDVIYNPEETNFLKEGKKLGNRTENGKLMFVYQAFEAFKLWHGIEPKINSEILEILNND